MVGKKNSNGLLEELENLSEEEIKELRKRLGELHKHDKSDTKLSAWIIQVICILLALALFSAEQATLVKTEVPEWIYLVFLGGFLSAYDILALIPLVKKLKVGE